MEMAFYEEEEVWKCPKHPSKRRKSGICPTCLRERLVTLCPDCANKRPCACCAAATTSSSSSSSSSFSLFSSRGGGGRQDTANSAAGIGEVGRVSNLIDSEPAFRRSRSVAIPFLRSRSRFVGNGDRNPPPPVSRRKISFWSVFKMHKSEKDEEERKDEKLKRNDAAVDDDYSRLRRSRSVAVGAVDSRPPGGAAKGRGWYFPSPIKAFRQLKTSKVVQEGSPLHRG